jgi:hypothetical protein
VLIAELHVAIATFDAIIVFAAACKREANPGGLMQSRNRAVQNIGVGAFVARKGNRRVQIDLLEVAAINGRNVVQRIVQASERVLAV